MMPSLKYCHGVAKVNTEISEQDYKEALRRRDDPDTSDDHSEDFNQLCRRYRGEIFNREMADRALWMIRSAT
jgi:hypothetical protein